MAEVQFSVHPLWQVLVDAYRFFRAGEPWAALKLLEPVVGGNELAYSPSPVTALLWALAGDCYFRIGQPDKGFRAYRRAIVLDPHAGCLTLFACQVAWHERAEYAEEALRCLETARAADRQALRKHPLHFLWHSLGPESLHLRFIRLPLARRRLRRLAAEAKRR